MDRDRILILIALPIISVAGFLLWKEYGEYYGKPPVAQLPEVSLPTLSKNASDASTTATLSPGGRGQATEEVLKGRTAEQAAIIARAKGVHASSLDSSLPNQSVAEWMRSTAGASARVVWETNDCGEVAAQPGTVPVCAQANIDFSDGTRFQALLLMGTRTLKSRSVQFADASLMWAAYSKSDGDALTPAPLSALARIAQATN